MSEELTKLRDVMVASLCNIGGDAIKQQSIREFEVTENGDIVIEFECNGWELTITMQLAEL